MNGANLVVDLRKRHVGQSLAFSLTTHARERSLRSGLSNGLGRLLEIVIFEPEQKGDRLAVSRKHYVLFSRQFANKPRPISQIAGTQKFHTK